MESRELGKIHQRCYHQTLLLTLKNKAFFTEEGQLDCCDCQLLTWFGPQSIGTNSSPSESAEPFTIVSSLPRLHTLKHIALTTLDGLQV